MNRDSTHLQIVSAFGANEAEGIDAVLGNARWAAVDADGAVYVADTQTMSVKQYAPDGTFLRAYGSRGEGPGEFSDITTLAVRHGQLYVFDWMRRRLSVFADNGELQSTYRLLRDAVYWPREAVILGDGSAILLFKHLEEDELLHHVQIRDDSLDVRPIQSWATIDEVYKDGASDFVRGYAGFDAGSITALDDSTLIFAPLFYGGTLYKYRRAANGWHLAQEIQVRTPSGPAVEQVDGEPFPPSAHVFHSSGTHAGLIRRQSAGPARAAADRLLHFVFERDSREEQYISVEQINLSGGSSEVLTLLKLGSDRIYTKTPWFVVGSDDSGRVYAIDGRGADALNVLE